MYRYASTQSNRRGDWLTDRGGRAAIQPLDGMHGVSAGWLVLFVSHIIQQVSISLCPQAVHGLTVVWLVHRLPDWMEGCTNVSVAT